MTDTAEPEKPDTSNGNGADKRVVINDAVLIIPPEDLSSELPIQPVPPPSVQPATPGVEASVHTPDKMDSSTGKKRYTYDSHMRPVDLENESDVTVIAGERLYIQALEWSRTKDQKAKQAQEQRELHELDGVTFKPELKNKTEKFEKDHMDEFVKRMMQWKAQLKRKKDEKIKKILSEQNEDVTFAPAMDKLSKRLVDYKKKHNMYTGPVRGWKTRFQNYMQKKSESYVEHMIAQSTPFHPTISPNSRSLNFLAPVDERLYADVEQRRHHRQLLRTWEGVRQGFDVMTGQPLFHPFVPNAYRPRSVSPIPPEEASNVGLKPRESPVTPSSSNMSDMHAIVPVEDYLIRLGEHYRSRRDNLRNQQIAALPFKPSIGKRTQDILSTKGPRPQFGSTQWIRGTSARPCRMGKQASSQTPATESCTVNAKTSGLNSSTTTSRPTHNHSPTSTDGTAPSGSRRRARSVCSDPNAFYERMTSLVQYREERLALMREERTKEEISSCTFIPKISARSQELFEQSHIASMDYYTGLSSPSGGTSPGALPGTVTPNRSHHHHHHHPNHAGVLSPNYVVLREWGGYAHGRSPSANIHPWQHSRSVSSQHPSRARNTPSNPSHHYSHAKQQRQQVHTPPPSYAYGSDEGGDSLYLYATHSHNQTSDPITTSHQPSANTTTVSSQCSPLDATSHVPVLHAPEGATFTPPMTPSRPTESTPVREREKDHQPSDAEAIATNGTTGMGHSSLHPRSGSHSYHLGSHQLEGYPSADHPTRSNLSSKSPNPGSNARHAGYAMLHRAANASVSVPNHNNMHEAHSSVRESVRLPSRPAKSLRPFSREGSHGMSRGAPPPPSLPVPSGRGTSPSALLQWPLTAIAGPHPSKERSTSELRVNGGTSTLHHSLGEVERRSRDRSSSVGTDPSTAIPNARLVHRGVHATRPRSGTTVASSRYEPAFSATSHAASGSSPSLRGGVVPTLKSQENPTFDLRQDVLPHDAAQTSGQNSTFLQELEAEVRSTVDQWRSGK